MVEDSRSARYIAEFVGTYLLVFTVGCNVISGSPAWAVTSIACVLMVSIYGLGAASGAHLNPAVSVALGLSNKFTWTEVGIYAGVQIIAGICGALSYGALFWQVFNLAPQPGFGWWEAWLAETLYTCMLCFVVLNVAATEKNRENQFYGLAIGFVIVAGGYAVGGISGAVFNPAVALGIDVSSAGLGFGWGLIYAAYEMLGALLAAVLFRLVRPDEFVATGAYGLGTKLLSEFIGTFFLVLTVGLNVLGKSAAPAWSIAATLMCMIYALGNCSGGHFNPAVTLAILGSNRKLISPIEAGAYIGVQIVAGICGAFLYAAIHHGASFALEPAKGFSYGHVAAAEIVYTFVLCYVVLCVATVRDASLDIVGLAIGSCVTVGGYAIGSVSGGSLNPAVSVGISCANLLNHGHVYSCLVYSAFEFVGALLAAGIFRVTHPDEYK